MSKSSTVRMGSRFSVASDSISQPHESEAILNSKRVESLRNSLRKGSPSRTERGAKILSAPNPSLCGLPLPLPQRERGGIRVMSRMCANVRISLATLVR